MNEIWKDIKGYEGKYQVSNLGNIKNYHPTSIKQCCEGKRKQAYGYKWQYAI